MINNFNTPNGWRSCFTFELVFSFYFASFRSVTTDEAGSPVEGEPHTPNTQPRMEKI